MSNKQRKVAVVTGSATGIGANIAVDLAACGYIVIVTGRNLQNLNKVVEQCNKSSGSNSTVAHAVVCDLFDIKQVDRLVDYINTNFHQIHLLVNNACWRGNLKSILEIDKDQNDFNDVMHVNVLMPMYLIHKLLIPQRDETFIPVVINISSIASQVVVPLHLYSISKACLTELSNQLSQLENLFSVAISPGPVLTEERPHHNEMRTLTLCERVGTTQEISDLVIFALKNIHLFNGKELTIDGGYLAKQR